MKGADTKCPSGLGLGKKKQAEQGLQNHCHDTPESVCSLNVYRSSVFSYVECKSSYR